MARAAPIALRYRARGSKFSRRPQRSYSDGAVKLMSHICDSACPAVRQRAAQDGEVHGQGCDVVPGILTNQSFRRQ